MVEFGRIHRQVIEAASTAPYLERGEERELARRWREEGDEEALHLLASSHIRLVLATARRFRHYKLPLADLVQEGSVGLLEAAARYEPAARDALLHLCLLVDPRRHPGLCLAKLVDRAGRHELGSEIPLLQFAQTSGAALPSDAG